MCMQINFSSLCESFNSDFNRTINDYCFCRAPYLNKELTITKPEVNFRVYKQRVPVANSGGIYDLVNPNIGVVAGCWIYLELEYSLPVNFTRKYMTVVGVVGAGENGSLPKEWEK